MNKALSIFLTCCWLGNLQGQMLPDPSCVALPPIGKSWSVSLEYPRVEKPVEHSPEGKKSEEKVAVPEPAPVLPLSLHMTTGKNGVSMGHISYSDGTNETFHLAGGMIFIRATNTGKVFALRADADDMISLKTAAFPGTAWIQEEFRKPPMLYKDRECLHFFYQVGEGDPNHGAGRMEAWLEKGTLVPIDVVVDGTVGGTVDGSQPVVFHFSPLAEYDKDVVLPQEYREVFEQSDKRKKALDKIRALNQKAP